MTRLALGNYALIAAGVLAVIVAAPAAHAVGATGAGEELQYVTTTNVNMPGILKMFMGHKMDQPPSTTTISTTRTRHDDGKGNTLIVQCDLRRIININDNNKTYSVLDFDDVMKQVTATLAAAQAKAGTPPPSTTINGTGSTTISMSEKTDDQTQVIAGLTAHHAIDTITIATKGTGDCPNMSQSMSEDIWYADSPVKMSCPTKLPPPPAMPSGPGGKGGNPCAQNFAIQMNSVKSAQPRIVLKSTMGLPEAAKAGYNISTTTLVTSLKTQPYDPAFFDIPAGYTKVDAAAMESPPPHR